MSQRRDARVRGDPQQWHRRGAVKTVAPAEMAAFVHGGRSPVGAGKYPERMAVWGGARELCRGNCGRCARLGFYYDLLTEAP
jgi:hypothetical protein